MVTEGAKVVISGNIGPNAFLLLKRSEVEIYNSAGLTAKDALDKHKKRELI